MLYDVSTLFDDIGIQYYRMIRDHRQPVAIMMSIKAYEILGCYHKDNILLTDIPSITMFGLPIILNDNVDRFYIRESADVEYRNLMNERHCILERCLRGNENVSNNK